MLDSIRGFRTDAPFGRRITKSLDSIPRESRLRPQPRQEPARGRLVRSSCICVDQSHPFCLLFYDGAAARRAALGLAPKMADFVFEMVVRLRDEGLTVLLIEQKARQALKIAGHAFLMETGRILFRVVRKIFSKTRSFQRHSLARAPSSPKGKAPNMTGPHSRLICRSEVSPCGRYK
jgi:hypothetical protein